MIQDPAAPRAFIVTKEESEGGSLAVFEDGWFQVKLPPGRYCVWEQNNCLAQFDIRKVYVTIFAHRQRSCNRR